jgi:hypothetical protein
MTINVPDKSITFTAKAPNGKYESTNRNGNKTLTINGTGLLSGGSPPTIAIWREWMDGNTGTEFPLAATGGDIGDFTAGNYATGIKGKRFTVNDSQGASIREGGFDADVDNRRAGFTKVVDPFTEILVLYSEGVPEGHYFSGTSAVETLPVPSVYKPIWLSDGPLDDPLLADIVYFSYAGVASGWVIDGNQSPESISLGTNSYDFSKFNSRGCYQKAGADPFLDNGITRAMTSNPNSSTIIKEVLDQPMFAHATNARFTYINGPAWTGEANQDNVLHVHRNYYVAVGGNAGKVVVMGDASTIAACKEVRPLPHSTWTDTKFTSITASSKLREGMTHYFVLDLEVAHYNSPITSGELSWQ